MDSILRVVHAVVAWALPKPDWINNIHLVPTLWHHTHHKQLALNLFCPNQMPQTKCHNISFPALSDAPLCMMMSFFIPIILCFKDSCVYLWRLRYAIVIDEKDREFRMLSVRWDMPNAIGAYNEILKRSWKSRRKLCNLIFTQCEYFQALRKLPRKLLNTIVSKMQLSQRTGPVQWKPRKPKQIVRKLQPL